jgi:hypothetical protein
MHWSAHLLMTCSLFEMFGGKKFFHFLKGLSDLQSIAIDLKLITNIVMRKNGMFFQGFAWTPRQIS